jgi:hypothetical protein
LSVEGCVSDCRERERERERERVRSGWWNRKLELRTQVLVLIERLLLTDPEALGLLGVEIVVLFGHVCWVRMYGAASSS